MKTIKYHSENTAKINYIIYELNDTVLLLNCSIRKNNKTYFSNIPITLLAFSQLMLTLKDHQLVLDKISESLFNKEDLINHVCPSNLLKADLIVNIDDLFSLSNPIRISA